MIFVDDIAYFPRSRKFRYSCHICTDNDNLDELHFFVTNVLHIPITFFQPFSYPHYNLTSYKRNEAIRKGAIPVTNEELIQKCIIDNAINFYRENKKKVSSRMNEKTKILAHLFMVYAIAYSKQSLEVCLIYAYGDYKAHDDYIEKYLKPKYIYHVLPEKVRSLQS